MKHKIIGFVVLASLVGGGVVVFTRVLQANNEAEPNSSSESDKTDKVEEKKYKVDAPALDASINAILAGTTMDVSIAITDLTTGKNYQYGDEAAYTAASVTKLLTAAMYLKSVENGTATLDTIVGGKKASIQLEQLIVNSDNAAWDSLVIKLKWAGLNAYARELGMTSFDAASNVITAKDMTKLLTALYKRELLNEEHTKLLLGFMERAGEHEHVPKVVVPGVTAYHKAGWLTDRVHDVLIITNGKHAFAMSTFTKSTGAYDVAAGMDFLSSVNTATIDAFILKQP